MDGQTDGQDFVPLSGRCPATAQLQPESIGSRAKSKQASKRQKLFFLLKYFEDLTSVLFEKCIHLSNFCYC